MKTSRRGFLKAVLALAAAGVVQPRKFWTGWDSGSSPVEKAVPEWRIESIVHARVGMKLGGEWVDLGGFVQRPAYRFMLEPEEAEAYRRGLEEFGKACADSGDRFARLAEEVRATNELLRDGCPGLERYISGWVDTQPGKTVILPVVRPCVWLGEQETLGGSTLDYITLFGRPVYVNGRRIRSWDDVT